MSSPTFTLAKTYKSITPSGKLTCSLATGPGKWADEVVDLNDYLGFLNGNFDLTRKRGEGFAKHAADGSIKLKGNILSAQFPQPNEVSYKTKELNLDLIVVVRRGKLFFVNYADAMQSLTFTTSAQYLDGSSLHALALTSFGELWPTVIDLNQYYGNDDGEFVAGGRFFFNDNNARGLYLETTKEGLVLKGELRNKAGKYQAAETNLSVNLVNASGRLSFRKHDGFFDRDGLLATFLDDKAFIGLVVATVHYFAGNKDHAQAALATSLPLAATTAAGFLSGGPISGLLVAAMGTPIQMFATDWIAEMSVDDPRLFEQFDEVTVGKALVASLKGVAGKTLGQHLNKWVEKTSQPLLEKIGNEYVNAVVKQGSKFVTGQATKEFINRVADAVEGEVVAQWEDTEKLVNAWEARHAKK